MAFKFFFYLISTVKQTLSQSTVFSELRFLACRVKANHTVEGLYFELQVTTIHKM